MAVTCVSRGEAPGLPLRIAMDTESEGPPPMFSIVRKRNSALLDPITTASGAKELAGPKQAHLILVFTSPESSMVATALTIITTYAINGRTAGGNVTARKGP